MKKNNGWILCFILILATALGIVCFYADTDVMWHYKTGEYIVLNKGIPPGDVFSWHTGLNWMCHEWLYDVGLYLLYSNFGIAAARFLLIAVFAAPILISYFYNNKN